MPRANPIVAASLATVLAGCLAGCGNNSGGFAPSPAPYEPPAKEVAAAKADPRFKPYVQAILAQRKASKDLADFRAQFGATGMDEAAGKKYQELFAKVAEAGQKVSDMVGAANFEGDDKRVFDTLVSMNDEQLKALYK